MTSPDNERPAVVVQRVLPASPQVVYDEWLDAAGMGEWMCPRPVRPTSIELDARVGGRFRIEMDDEGYAVSVTGTYLELNRPRRLSFTWTTSAWPASEPDSIVTVTFEAHGDADTLMTIRHTQLPPARTDRYRAAWVLVGHQLHDRLAASATA